MQFREIYWKACADFGTEEEKKTNKNNRKQEHAALESSQKIGSGISEDCRIDPVLQ